MNQANLDYLYQVFTPAADRTLGASRAESQTVGFDVHLNQASTSVFDVVHAPRRDDTRGKATPSSDNRGADSNRSRSTAADSSQDAQSSQNRNDGNATESSCTDCVSTESQIEDSQSNSNDVDHKDREDDAATDNDAAAGTVAASSGQTPQRPLNETKAHKEHDKNAAEAATKATTEEAAETIKAASAVKKASHLQANASADATIAEAATGAGETSEPAAMSLEDKPEEGAEAAQAHSVKRHGSDKEVPAQGLSSEATEGHPISDKQTASASSAEQTAASGNTTKETASVKRRTSSAIRDTDEDGTSNNGKQDTDAAGSRATADGTGKTPIATAVSSSQSTVNADTDSGVIKTGDDESTAIAPAGNRSETALGPLGKSLRSAVEMNRGQKTVGAGDAPHVDPARFVSRVAKAIHTANERGGALQFRLAPPELGSLKIELNIKDGVMSAALEADNASARRLLLDHLPALRERLAEQNIRVERFDVDVRQDETSGQQANSRGSNHNPFQQHQAESQSQPRRTNHNAHMREVASPEPSIVAARITNTAINLVV